LNEQDKILLSAYLDSGLNDVEIKDVEELLQNNEEARDYLESMKQVKLENKNFFENSLQSQTFKESSSFLKELQAKQTKKFSLYDFLFERKLLFSNMGTLSAAILVFFVANEQPEYGGSDTLLDLDSVVYEEVVFKTRGASDELNNNKELLKKTISKMILNNSAEGNLTYGSESFVIFIDAKKTVNEDLLCYSGDIFNLGNKQRFSFCISKNEEVLIYLN